MSILEQINSSNDIKKLNDNELVPLCAELREFLVENVSKTGGHLASNLGAVELTVALHRVYNTAKDRLVFDVGHQCYVHKIITGRREQFDTLRQYGGISGFPKPYESEDDAFIAGHASNSVSVALGMAKARTLLKEDYDVVAFIGDGNNMANSYLFGAAKAGMTLAVATPKSHQPDKTVVKVAMTDAKETGATIILTEDPAEAVKGADAVVTDTWASMGQEAEHDERKKIFASYQVNEKLLKKADRRAVVMHCLPAYRDEEITEDVFEANADVIFDEAENRLHVQKAIMAILMGE
mgnify:CR=1 FL=1